MTGIGITGRKRAGKDTAAQVLRDEFGYTRIGFADQVKRLALVLNPAIPSPYHPWNTRRLAAIVGMVGWERAKDRYPEVRAFLQRQGDGTRQVLGDAVWLDAWGKLADQIAGPLVVPDTRYLNEADHLNSLGFPIIRVIRPGVGDGDDHVSETEQDGIEADVTVENTGSVEQFRADVREALGRLGVEPVSGVAA